MNIDSSVFILVDVQGKLAQLMHDKDTLFANLKKLISGIKVLNIPVIWMEQNPEKMGGTIPELADLLPDEAPIPKMSFSCYGDPAFMEALTQSGRKQVILAGIETHVCLWQTTTDLLANDYEVAIVTDAVSSREKTNKHVALERMKVAGVQPTTVEMILFELMKTAEHPAFRDVLKIVK